MATPYQHNLPRRKRAALADYDYSTPGYYFVTIVTHNRRRILKGEIANAARRVWRRLPDRYPSLALDEFVIMPDHIHGILAISDGAASRPDLIAIVRAFKSLTAKECNALVSGSGKFWQRSFYERVIRSERELFEVRQYIRNNPSGFREYRTRLA